MGKYIKKRIIIEAVVYEKGLEDGFSEVIENGKSILKPYLNTLEGNLYIEEGSYIVTGIKGERYAVRKDIFEETYEEVFDDIN